MLDPVKKYNVLIFDADETLFDYLKGEAYALEQTLTEAGIPYRTPYHLDLYSEINGGLWREFECGKIDRERLRTERFKRLFSVIGANNEDIQRVGERYLEHLGRAGYLYPEASRLLDSLRGKYTLSLLTNGFSQVQRSRIDMTDTSKYFATVVISEETGYQKPQREIFEVLLRNIDHNERDDVLMIGDSYSSDIVGGFNAEIDTCWLNRSGSPPDGRAPTYEIADISSLAELLGV